MSEQVQPESVFSTGIGVVVAVQGVALWFGALAHTGVEIPLGVVVISEPQILPAIIVEGICGFLLIGSAYALFTRKSWTWEAVVIAQTIALAGVLLGITAIAMGAGPHTPANELFHRVMLVLLGSGLVLSFLPKGRAAINRTVSSTDESNEPEPDEWRSRLPIENER